MTSTEDRLKALEENNTKLVNDQVKLLKELEELRAEKAATNAGTSTSTGSTTSAPPAREFYSSHRTNIPKMTENMKRNKLHDC